MFSIFEVFSGYMRTVVLPDNMSIFQEGIIRKPGKQKGKKVPLQKNFLISYLMTPTILHWMQIRLQKIIFYLVIFLHWIRSDSVSKEKYRIDLG